MLILAGVSLNAIIGDNGIITNAQTANMKNGMAALEEFLQQKYVENYEKFNNDESKVYQLQTLYPSYFYIPSAEGVGGLRYIVDSKGHALYLIKKSGLPKEIKEQLIGGNAGAGTYTDYATLNDVYGVTADLKVYYSEGTGATLFGLTEDDLDNDNPQREVFNSTGNTSGMYNLLSGLGYDQNGDGKISSEEVKPITDLTISSTSSVTSLADFYNLTSLEKLTIESKTLSSLDGIQNCTKLYYLCLRSCTIGDYSALLGNTKKLQYLYFYNIDDNELSNACNGIKAGAFSQLNYLLITGSTDYIGKWTSESKDLTTGKSTKTITSLEPLSYLHKSTKSAIQYLGLSNNNIGEGENGSKNFSLISDFTALIVLRFDNNSITSLSGLANMNSLSHIFGRNNKIGTDFLENGASVATDSISAINAKSSLQYLDLENNSKLKYVDYLSGSSLNKLYLAGCDRSMNVNNIATVILGCGVNYSLPCKFLNGTKYKWSDYYYTGSTAVSGKEQLTAEKLKSDLENNTTITALFLNNCRTSSNKDTNEITNDVLNEILKTMPQLKYLTITGTFLETLDFCELITEDEEGNELTDLEQYAYCPNLIELIMYNTYVSDVSNLANVIKKTTKNPNGRNMGTLALSKSNTLDSKGDNIVLDLQPITAVINGLTGQKYWADNNNTYLDVYDFATFSALASCTSLTRLYCKSSGGWATASTVSFTNLTNLRRILLRQCNVHVIIPKSCSTEIEIRGSYYFPTIESGGRLTSVIIDCPFHKESGTSDNWKTMVRMLSNITSVNTLTLSGCWHFENENSFYDEVEGVKTLIWSGSNCGHLILEGTYNWGLYGDLDLFDGLKNLSSLKNLTIKGYRYKYIAGSYNHDYSFTETSFWTEMNGLVSLTFDGNTAGNYGSFGEMPNLKFLDLSNNNIISLDGIKSLKNIISLNLSNNKISDLGVLKNLKTLGSTYYENNVEKFGYLNLNNNLIYDTSSYVDENGETVTYNNMKILAELNPSAGKGGYLRKLYISENPNILDKSILRSYKENENDTPITLNWNDSLGF